VRRFVKHTGARAGGRDKSSGHRFTCYYSTKFEFRPDTAMLMDAVLYGNRVIQLK